MDAIFSRFFVFFLVMFGLALASASLFAQSGQGLAERQFGLGQPSQISDLPPGQLRRSLESLSPQASSRALRWLQEIEFTGTDLEILRVDEQGGVYFEDVLLPDATLEQQAPSATTAAEVPSSTLADAFALHSRPGAPNVVYLDFNGHVFTATAWGSGTFSGVPYDLDGNPASFNDTERVRIVDIWHRVAEDLAPYNIDVTTEAPANFTRYTGRVLVTRDTDATGKNMPSKGAGGVAYVNVFGLSNYHTYYSPALVYFNNLGGGVETYIAEASSHEFGHNLGLSHDGTTTGTTYYAGHGSGLVSWAPIMGNSYYNNVTEWSKGEYPNANQAQDDLSIIQAKLGLKPDDHGDAPGAGSVLVIGADGSVVSSNPELDPHNLLTENKGVINSRVDVDVFSFTAGAGSLSLSVRPAWDAFYRSTSRRGANLDIKAELRNAAGSLVASNDPATDTFAAVSATVAAGTYHLLVWGEGNGTTTTGYSDYASLGQYFINGNLTSGSGDSTPPVPNPMTWASPPAATSDSAIAMTATVATDETSVVQYNFQCLAGGGGCVSSGWKSSNSHTATGLVASTSYTFNVIARDQSGNATGAAPSMSATTQAPPPPPPAGNLLAVSETRIAGTVSGTYANTHADDGSTESIRERESGGSKNSRYSYLELRWNFTLASSQSLTAWANAWSSGSTDGDTFRFEYSVNGGSSWNALFTVSSTSSSNVQSSAVINAPAGTMIVRVLDTNRVAGKRELNTVFIDQLYLKPQ